VSDWKVGNVYLVVANTNTEYSC